MLTKFHLVGRKCCARDNALGPDTQTKRCEGVARNYQSGPAVFASSEKTEYGLAGWLAFPANQDTCHHRSTGLSESLWTLRARAQDDERELQT